MKQAPAHPKPRNDSGSVSAAMFGSGYRFPLSVVSLTGFARFPDSGRARKPLCIPRLCLAARMAIFVLSALLWLVISSSALVGQISGANNTPKEGVGHDYIGELNEVVNPADGSVSLKFDFSPPPGRGISPKFSLLYNSSMLTTPTVNSWGTPFGVGLFFNSDYNLTSNPNVDNGWSYTFPYVTFTQSGWINVCEGGGWGEPVACTCPYYSNYTFYDEDGAGHNLPLALTEDASMRECKYQTPSLPAPVLNGGDDEYWASMAGLNPGQAIYGTQVTVRGRDGTVYKTGWDILPLPGNTASIENVEDRNGNFVSYTYSGGIISGIIDTLGRTAVQAAPLGTDGGQVTVSGLPGSYTLHWAPLQNSGYNINYGFTAQDMPEQAYWPEVEQYAGAFPNCLNGQAAVTPFTGNTLTSLVLPNGQQYTLTYDSTYGRISKITYPSGGNITYIWNAPPFDYNNPSDPSNNNINWLKTYGTHTYQWLNTISGQTLYFTQGCTFKHAPVVLTDRYVDFGDGRGAVLHQTYTYTTTPDSTDAQVADINWQSKTTTVTTYDLTVSATQPVSTVTYTYTQPQYNPGLVSPPFRPQPQPPILADNSINAADYVQPPFTSPVPVEATVDTSDGSEHDLSTVNKNWLTTNLLQSSFTTTYTNTGTLTSGTCDTYDLTSWQRTEEDDYDFVSGSIICGQTPITSKTTWQYETYQNLQPSWTYLGVTSGILDESCKKITYDGSGNRIAETDSYYDNGTTLCGAPGTPQVGSQISNLPANTHDETNYGASNSWSRGNLTTSVSLCFAGSWTCPQNPSTTAYFYDETGQLTSMTDPNLHTTNYGYTDNYTALSGGVNVPYASSANTNARLTKVTDPSGYITSYAYDYSSGQLTRVTDPNSQSTTYVYSDSFSRPTQANYPDGGQTTISYNDSPPSPSVTTIELLSSNPASSIVTTKKFDGMGHPRQTILSSDPYGPDYTDTTYYGTGQVHTVSNPYRSTSDPTYGTTTYAYDGLGRKVTATNPDNSIKQWCYNGVNTSAQTNCASHASVSTGQWVDSADENSNDWQQTTDGLGRLIVVNEPNGSPQGQSMETDYQYDLLNNLTKVTQKGNGTTDSPRIRTFTYDSLSQLLCANNPENSNTSAPCPLSTAYSGYVAGTTGYWYDPNGNLAAKEDARGVTTSYSYDQLNRLLKKSYSDGFTPTSCYLYDSAINGVHRLASEWTQKASNLSCSSPFAPQGGYFSARWIRAYDAMGRIQTEQQYTPNSIANGKFYPMSYTYDLAGNVTSSTAGAVPPGMTTSQASAPCASAPVLNTQMFTFLSCYDAAGRLQGVTSNASSGPSALLFTAQWYPPFIGLPNAVYGNNAVTLTRGYDRRLRITSEQDLGNSPLSATNGSSLLTITGDEQSY